MEKKKNVQESALDVSLEALEEAIKKHNRQQVLTLLQQSVLKQVPEDQRDDVYRRLFLLRDKKIVELMAKEDVTFHAEMFELEFSNSNNREIVAFVFDKYIKKLDLTQKEKCEHFFRLGCKVESMALLRHMIQNQQAVDCYPMLVTGSDELAGLVTKIKKENIDNDFIVKLFVNAALSNSYAERIDFLCDHGFDVKTQNSDGKDALALLDEWIQNTKYAKNKNGDLQRQQNRNARAYLNRRINPKPKQEIVAQDDTEDKTGAKTTRRNIIIVIIAIAAAVAVLLAVHQHMVGSDDVTATSAISEEVSE